MSKAEPKDSTYDLEKGSPSQPSDEPKGESNPAEEQGKTGVSKPQDTVKVEQPNMDTAAAGQTEDENNPYVAHCQPDARIWQMYLKEAETEDKETTDIWNSSLDSLLVFAGLFAGVVTAFLIESLKGLKQDPQEALLQRIADLLRNQSDSSDSQPFQPDPSSRHINGLWIISLTSTLLSALGAVLAKGWVARYNPATHREQLADAYARIRRVIRAKQWHLEGIITGVPLLIQVSLFLFFAGLIAQITDNDPAVWLTAVVLISLAGLLYIVGTILPWLFPSCPFQTPISNFWPRQTAQSQDPDRLAESDKRDRQSKSWLKRLCSLPDHIDHIHKFWKTIRDEPTEPNLKGRILSWIIMNSTNQVAIEEAFKAVAGLEPTRDLQDALFESGALNVLAERLRNCVKLTPGSPKAIEDNPQLDYLLYAHFQLERQSPTIRDISELEDSPLLLEGQALHQWDAFRHPQQALAFSLRVHMLVNRDQDDHKDWMQQVESLDQLAQLESPLHLQKYLLLATLRGICGGKNKLKEICQYLLPRLILSGKLAEHATFRSDIEEAVSQLVNLLEGSDETVCSAAASAIGRLAEQVTLHKVIRTKISQLFNQLKNSNESRLVNQLKGSNKDVRSSAASAIGRLAEQVTLHEVIHTNISQLFDQSKGFNQNARSAAESAIEKLAKHVILCVKEVNPSGGLAATTESEERVCTQFRLLVAGKSGAGKSSLLSAAFELEKSSESKFETGEANTDQEIRSTRNPHFVLHDSRGFEPGENESLEALKDFIKTRNERPGMKDKLHAIWLCITVPFAGERVLETGVEEILQMKQKGSLENVLVILVLTKYDRLVDETYCAIEDLPGNTLSTEQIQKQAIKDADTIIGEYCLEPLKRAIGTHMVHAVVSSKILPTISKRRLTPAMLEEPDYEKTLKDLVDLTVGLLTPSVFHFNPDCAKSKNKSPDPTIVKLCAEYQELSPRVAQPDVECPLGGQGEEVARGEFVELSGSSVWTMRDSTPTPLLLGQTARRVTCGEYVGNRGAEHE